MSEFDEMVEAADDVVKGMLPSRRIEGSDVLVVVLLALYPVWRPIVWIAKKWRNRR